MRGVLPGIIALLVFGLALPGCKSTKKPVKKPVKGAKKPADNKGAKGGKQPAKGPEMNAAEKKALGEVQNATAEMKKMVDQARKQMAANDQKGALDTLKKANAAFEGVKTKMRKPVADRFVPDLHKTAAQIASLKKRAEEQMGAEAGDGSQIGDVVARGESVARQRLIEKIKRNMKTGGDAAKAKKYAQAIKAYESVLEDLNWTQYDIPNAKNIQQEASKALERAKRDEKREAIRADQARLAKVLADEQAAIRAAQEKRQRRIQELYRQASFAFQGKNFTKAEELASEILRINPGDKVAKRLHEDAVESRHEQARVDMIRDKVERWRRFSNDMLETRTPYADILRFPSAARWRMATDRSRTASAGDERAFALQEDASVTKIKQKLREKKITFDFTETPFADVVQFIQQVGGINIVVDQNAKSKLEESDGEGAVTLNVNDLKIESALNLLLQFKGLAYTFNRGVLQITTPDSEANKGSSIVRIHDIRDLTSKINDFKGPDIRLGTGGGAGPGVTFDDDDGGDEEPITSETLIDLVKSQISPDSWESDGNSISSVAGQLLVVNTPKVQAEVNSFLNDLRQFAGLMVHIETRFVEATDDFLQDIGVDFRGLGQNSGLNIVQPFGVPIAGTGTGSFVDNTAGTAIQAAQTTPFAGFSSQTSIFGQTPAEVRARTQHNNRGLGTRLTTEGGLSFQYTHVDGSQWQAILTAVRKSTKASVVSSPRITVFNTQRSFVSVLNQFAYVKDYDVEVAAQIVAADPEIGTVQDGLVLDVRPTVSHDRRYVTLEMRPTVSFLVKPIPSRTIGLGGSASAEVRIQMPNITLHQAETTVRVPDRGAVVIGGLKTINIQDLRSETPILSKIPILSFFFSRKGKAEELRGMVIVAKATILDLQEEEERQRGRDSAE